MSNSNDNEEEEDIHFDWLQLKQDMHIADQHLGETTRQKLNRKILENPFVPIGCLATVAALTMGLNNFRKGNSKMSQTMMRARILAQGFTVLALVGGVTYTAKSLNKH